MPRFAALNVLLIDDEPNIRRTVRIALESLGHRVADAAGSPQALELLSRRTFEVAFLDLRLGQEQGLDLLPQLRQVAPDLQVIVMTAYATIETAVESMRLGAADFILKPMTPEQLRVAIARSAGCRRLQQVGPPNESMCSAVPAAYMHTEESSTIDPEVLASDDLPNRVAKPSAGIEVGAPVTLEQIESEHIRQIIATTETMEVAAKILGIDPSTLFRKRKRGLY